MNYYAVLDVLTPDLRLRIGAYVETEKLPVKHLTRTDIALALLRINTEASLAAAEALMGVRVKKLPPAIPPWPPKPVVSAKPAPRVVQVNHSRGFTQTEAAERFRWVKPGMTVEQLVQRGISRRDIRTWTRRRRIVFA